MIGKRVTVTFNSGWVLRHLKELEGFPAEILAEEMKQFPNVNVERVSLGYLVASLHTSSSDEEIAEKIHTLVSKKFGAEDVENSFVVEIVTTDLPEDNSPSAENAEPSGEDGNNASEQQEETQDGETPDEETQEDDDAVLARMREEIGALVDEIFDGADSGGDEETGEDETETDETETDETDEDGTDEDETEEGTEADEPHISQEEEARLMAEMQQLLAQSSDPEGEPEGEDGGEAAEGEESEEGGETDGAPAEGTEGGEAADPPKPRFRGTTYDEQLRLLQSFLAQKSGAEPPSAEHPAMAAERPQDARAILDQVAQMREELLKRVKGQVHAVEAFTAGLFAMNVHAQSGNEHNKPRAVFLFAGPPGVGKTYLAEQAASLLGLPFLRLDMSGFTDDSAAVESFRGINPSYKAASEGQVTSFVEKNPECLLLFDEIEKAHVNVIQLFLQILEGARCRDAFTEREVSFEKAIIIMTTNAGKSLYEDTDKRNFSDVSDRMVIDALKNDLDPQRGTPVFPTAILSRLAEGTVIMFNHLEPFSLSNIISAEMEKQLDSYRSFFKLGVTVDEKLPAAILYSQGGASDARTLKGAAKALIDEEMLALLRLEQARDLTEVSITLDMSAAKPEARALFRHEQKSLTVLLFGERKEFEVERNFRLVSTVKPEEAKTLVRGEVDCVVIDVTCGMRDMMYRPSDPEDVESDGVDFFRYVREYFSELPVYLLDVEIDGRHGDFRSFIRAGARDVVDTSSPEALAASMESVSRNVYLCREADALARTHKALYFNCAQVFSEDGTKAEIKLASMELKRNVSAEDSATILADSGKPNVHFSDVIGAEDAKETLRDFIDFLKHPRQFLAKGVRAPRGVLLYGAPGTGKTLLARALAGESDVTFIQKNATEFFKSYVGEGPRAIRETFRLARKYAPSILFVDEIDTIAKMRTGGEMTHAMEELQNTFLSEMDGFLYDEKRPVFVLAATNFAVEGEEGGRMLDPAFVRRFDRKIEIELPNTEERAQFLEYYLHRHGIFHVKKETIDNLALRSIGRSPADLELVVELAIRSMHGEQLTDKALEQALDHDRFGKERDWSQEVVERTSYHEGGHTVVSWFTGGKPTYVTNISRGSFGGYMLPEVDDGKFGYSKQEMLDRICCLLGGRAAEIVIYGREGGVTTGASSDLAAATQTARQFICRYGMDGESLVTLTPEELTGSAGDAVRRRINEILGEQLRRAIAVLNEHKDALEAIKNELVLRNSLAGQEIAAVLTPFTQS